MATDGMKKIGQGLRLQALALLNLAESLDKTWPWLITHTHSAGNTSIVGWFSEPPSEEQAAALLKEKFEPELGEYITIDPMDTEEVFRNSLPDTVAIVKEGPEASGLALRNLAAEVLQAAQDIDGRQPFGVALDNDNGGNVYVGWFKDTPNEAEAASLIEGGFDPETDATLSVHGLLIKELVGVMDPVEQVDPEEAEADVPR